jgi:hypothetical protein
MSVPESDVFADSPAQDGSEYTVNAGSHWIHVGCGGSVAFDISGGFCTGCEAEGLKDIAGDLAAARAERDDLSRRIAVREEKLLTLADKWKREGADTVLMASGEVPDLTPPELRRRHAREVRAVIEATQ